MQAGLEGMGGRVRVTDVGPGGGIRVNTHAERRGNLVTRNRCRNKFMRYFEEKNKKIGEESWMLPLGGGSGTETGPRTNERTVPKSHLMRGWMSKDRKRGN